MGLGQPGPDNAVAYWTTSQAFLHYSLFSAMFALGAAFVFFLVERGSVLPAYRATMTTSAMICGVAAVAYHSITGEYAPGKPFPSAVRYVDWTITTPLLLLKYPGMLKARGFAFAWKLIIADLFMIVTGFIGELYGSTIGGHRFPGMAVGDVINKVSFGVTAYLAVKALSGDDQESRERLLGDADRSNRPRINADTGRLEGRTH